MPCCIDCHVRSEERRVLSYLEPPVRIWLRSEHARLRKAGFPIEEVKKHAAQEMGIFRDQGVPSNTLALLDMEHKEIAAGHH